MKISNILILILHLFLSSCNYDNMMEKFVPNEESEFAKEYITKLRQKDFEYVKSFMNKDLLSELPDEKLLLMSEYFRKGELLSTKLIGSQVYTFNDTWQGNFTFEYKFSSGWNIANAAFTKKEHKIEIIGLNIYQTEKSQKEVHAFTLSSKSILHYFVLIMAVCVPIFILITTYFCVKTAIPRRKWLWIIFILLGIGKFSINWTTGQYGLSPVSLNLLGSGIYSGGPYSSWIISTSLPIGAILFWLNRKKFTAKTATQLQEKEL